MPEGYTHIRTARRAAEAVRYKVKCPAAFAAGANGPDTFFCFQAWKPARKRLYDLPALGRRLHNENTGAFLCSLVRHVRTVPQIEYTMGFLSHYATDTVIHPYVEALCRPGMPYARKGGHGYFEAALDTLLHEQDTGARTVPAADCAPVLAGEALADVANLLHTCLREVYDLDVPVEYLADSFHHATVLRGLFTSRLGVRRAFYWLIEPLFAGRGYITGHVTPRKMKKDLPAAWIDPFAGTEHGEDIFALLEQAQSRSEKYMAATILAWAGQQSGQALAEQLGSMSYLEGRSTAQSDPAFAPPPAPEPAEEPVPAESVPEPEAAAAPETAEEPVGAAPSGGPQEEDAPAGENTPPAPGPEPAPNAAGELAGAAPSGGLQEESTPAGESAPPEQTTPENTAPVFSGSLSDPWPEEEPEASAADVLAVLQKAVDEPGPGPAPAPENTNTEPAKTEGGPV